MIITMCSFVCKYRLSMDLKTGSILALKHWQRLRDKSSEWLPRRWNYPIAEKTKLILPIGEKVIIKAFSFLNRLKECGYENISVSINISAIQLLKPDFTSRLFKIMSEMRINPKNVVIEITETVFSSDFETINNIIGYLRDAGLSRCHTR